MVFSFNDKSVINIMTCYAYYVHIDLRYLWRFIGGN